MNSRILSIAIHAAGVALLLAGAFGVAPGRAEAGCGDYLMTGHDAVADQPLGHQFPKVPCHGPNCSNKPETPSPLPAPVPPSSETKACLTGLEQEAGDRGDRTIPHSSAAGPVHKPGSIFHPPRI
jgi:hypothetical protein